MHPAEFARDLQELEGAVGLGHQQLTRLCTPGSRPRLRPQCAPLSPAQTLQELRLGGWGGCRWEEEPPGTRLLRSTPRGPGEAGRSARAGTPCVLGSPASLAPAGGSYLRAWGAGTHAAAAAAVASGSRAAGTAGAAGGGGGAGTGRPELASPSAGWGGAAPASRGDRASAAAAGLPTASVLTLSSPQVS